MKLPNPYFNFAVTREFLDFSKGLFSQYRQKVLPLQTKTHILGCV